MEIDVNLEKDPIEDATNQGSREGSARLFPMSVRSHKEQELQSFRELFVVALI